MPLITPTLIRSRLTSLPDNDTVNAAIAQAIASSHMELETALNTALETTSYTDVFVLDKCRINPQSSMYVLKLSAGFVVPESVVVTYGADFYNLNESPQSIASSLYVVEAQKGFLHLSVPYDRSSIWPSNRTYRLGLGDLDGAFVKVSYTAGFDDGDTLPEWLIEGWCAKAVKMLVLQQMTEEKPEFYEMLKVEDAHSYLTVARKFRKQTFAIPPTYQSN